MFADSFYGHSLKSAFEFSLPFEGKRFLYHAPLLPRSGSGRQGVLNAVEVEHKGGHIYIYIYISHNHVPFSIWGRPSGVRSVFLGAWQLESHSF